MIRRFTVMLFGVLSACGADHERAIAPSGPHALSGATSPSRCLVVFFPGLGDDATSFEAHGFIDALRDAAIDADVHTVVAQDYSHDDYSTRVHDELIARRSGPVWLVGVSMGNAPLLRYASTHPDAVAGLVMIAPVVGGPYLTKRVVSAGRPSQTTGDDRDSRAVRWLGDRRRQNGSVVDAYLAYGRGDSLAPFAEAIEDELESTGGTVLVGGGGHSWEVWREYWSAFVDTGFFQRSCGTLGVR